MTTPALAIPISRSPLQLGFLLLVLGLSFVLLPTTRAVDSPPDGGYPNQNAAEGTDALFNLIPAMFTGVHNTAMGNNALFSTVSGSYNTATGSSALFSNTNDYNTATGNQRSCDDVRRLIGSPIVVETSGGCQ